MLMDDSELVYNSDQEVSENHSKFIDAVKQFDNFQRVKKPNRSEPSLDVSEFHLVKSGITNQNAVEIVDLAKTLKEKGHRTDISKKINVKIIPKPIEKPTAERIKRIVGFENSKKNLTRWTGIIARNRTAASVTFPLSQSSMKLESTTDCIKKFRLQSELEQKLLELESADNIENYKDSFPLSLKEITNRRKEAAKFRAQQSYKEAKAHRQNKIKSKKFHRVKRKDKIKKALKEFEDLQKTDPHAALDQLEKLDRIRVKERMTLRHKSTGQWAKNKQIKAKYDSNSRQMLVEQLSIGRELTQKVKTSDTSDEEDNTPDQQVCVLNSDRNNPWIKSANSQSEVDNFISDYKKYWNNENDKEVHADKLKCEVIAKSSLQELNNTDTKSSKISEMKDHTNNTNKLLKKSIIKKASNVKTFEEKSGTSLWLVSCNDMSGKKMSTEKDIDKVFELFDDKLQKKLKTKCSKLKSMLNQESNYIKKMGNQKSKSKNSQVSDIENLLLRGQTKIKPVVDKLVEEIKETESLNENLLTDSDQKPCKINSKKCVDNLKTKEIDPKNCINIKPKCLKTLIPDNVGEEHLSYNDAIDQHEIINEAFADDNITEQFREEKTAEVKKNQPTDVDLSLPGWGSWGGKDIKQSSRKKRRFIMKISQEESRRDENKGDVVIIEEKCPKIKQHLVSELPFPFTSVQDFEANMRVPLGRNFVPEKMFNKLIQPNIKTKMGKIIEPMTEDVLVKTGNLQT